MKRSFHLLIPCLVFLAFPPLSSGQPATTRLNLDQLVEEALQTIPNPGCQEEGGSLQGKGPQASALEDPMLEFGIVNLPTNFSFRDEDMTMKEIGVSQRFPFPGKRPLMREMAEKEAVAASTDIEDKPTGSLKRSRRFISRSLTFTSEGSYAEKQADF